MNHRNCMNRLVLVMMTSLLVWCLPVSSAAQVQGTVTGQVIDATSRAPLAAVQVFSPQLEIGTLTGGNGRFQLDNVPPGTYTLSARRLGYGAQNQEVTVGSGATVQVNFSLEQQALALDEVIVTGTPGGSQRRAIGNVVERLDATSILESSTVTNVEQMLSGRMPGVSVMQGSGMVGADAAVIRIRGSSSIGLSNDPIVYVDGVRINTDKTHTTASTQTGQYSRLNDINPEDIESIEVIKGPAAATLYGTEASNGVIQIITKRGVAGAPVFDVSTEFGYTWMPDPLGKMSPTYSRHPQTKEILGPFFLYQAETERFGKAPFNYGPLQRYNLGVRGGTDLLTYSAQFSRSDVTGIVDWNWDRRWSARATLGTTLADEQLNLRLTASYINGETQQAPTVWQEFVRGAPISAADYGGLDDPRRGYRDRPLEIQRDGQENLGSVVRSSWSGEIVYSPREWFRSRLVLGTEYTLDVHSNTTFREANAPFGFYGNAGLGSRDVADIAAQNYTVDLGSTARFRLTDNVGSATSAGLQFNAGDRWTKTVSGNQFLLPTLNTVSAASVRSGAEERLESRSVGVYLQQEFDWDQRRYLTVAVRGDDHSAFGANFNAAIYPKISGTWVLHEESFWPSSLPLEALRLRGAWGAAGQQPDAFASVQLYQPVTGKGDRPILTPFLIGNPDLGPERGEELELGFDTSLLGGRVDVAYTWYTKSTKDAIVSRYAAPSIGFPGRQFVNVGEVSNWGSELSLDLQIVGNGPVTLDFGVTGAKMGSRLEKLGLGDVNFLPVGRFRAHAEGFPLAGFFAIRVLSADFVNGESGAVKNAMCDGGLGPQRSVGMSPGGPPVPCNVAPRLYYGRGSEPTWFLNVTPRVSFFERLDLQANIGAQGGGMAGADWIGARHTSYANSLSGITQDDPIFMAYRQIDRNPLAFYKTGFAKLRDLSASYRIPAGWVQRFGVDRASIAVAGRNLATLWQEQSVTEIGNERVGDPEAVNLQGDDFPGEARAGAMPSLAQGTLTVRVSF